MLRYSLDLKEHMCPCTLLIFIVYSGRDYGHGKSTCCGPYKMVRLQQSCQGEIALQLRFYLLSWTTFPSDWTFWTLLLCAVSMTTKFIFLPRLIPPCTIVIPAGVVFPENNPFCAAVYTICCNQVMILQELILMSSSICSRHAVSISMSSIFFGYFRRYLTFYWVCTRQARCRMISYIKHSSS